MISSVSLDYDVNEFFKDSADEISYFSVRLQPLLYQDDIARVAPSVKSAQAGNIKMEVIANYLTTIMINLVFSLLVEKRQKRK